MTTDRPEFDPDLKHASAVEILGKCHAEVGDFTADGDLVEKTECGLVVRNHLPSVTSYLENHGRRIEWADRDDVDFCLDCWPQEIFDQ